MQTNPNLNSRASSTLSGAAAVHFVTGELSRLGYIALETVRNTKGIDVMASNIDLTKNVYIQVKANRNKYDFWIVGKPVQGLNVFYVFVNLLTKQINKRPEYFIVPSQDVQTKFDQFDNVKEYDALTVSDRKKVLECINQNTLSIWGIVEDLGISAQAIRRIAKDNNVKIRYDRGKGEDFPFCFYIRKNDEAKYLDNWIQLFDEGIKSI